MATSERLGNIVALKGRVQKWHEISTSNRMVRLKREHFEEAIEIIADEISLREGRKEFGDALFELFNGCDSTGSTTKVYGDPDDKTVLLANIHCISDRNNTITVTYAINTLSTDLPREGNRCPLKLGHGQGLIESLVGKSEISGLDKEMIERLAGRSEQSLRELMRPPAHQSRGGGILTALERFACWVVGRSDQNSDPDPDQEATGGSTPNPNPPKDKAGPIQTVKKKSPSGTLDLITPTPPTVEVAPSSEALKVPDDKGGKIDPNTTSKNGEGDMTMPATEKEKEENTDKNTNAKDKDEVKDRDRDTDKDKEQITETKNVIDTNKDIKEDCGEDILQLLR